MGEERKKSEIRVESEETVEKVVQKKSEKKKKKKNRENKNGEIAAHEGEKLGEDALVKKKSEKKSFNSESEDDGGKKSKKRNKEKRADSEADDDGVKKSKDTRVNSEADDDGEKKSKKKNKEKKVVDLEAEDGVQKSKKKKSKRESGGDDLGNSEGNRSDDAKRETGKRKRDDSDLGAEENTDKDMKRKSKKKKKPSVDSEVEENSLSSAKDAKKKIKEKKQSEDPEVEENSLSSAVDAKKKSKEKKPSVDSEVEENNNDSTKDAETKQSENSEAEGNDLNSSKDAKKKGKKKKKKQSADSDAEEENNDRTKDGKKKSKKKKPSEDSEAEENNNDSTQEGKKKRKKQQKGKKSDEDVTTPSSKSTKKVKFSDQVEVFPAEDEESEEEEESEVEEVELVRGKRFTKEEDELIKKSVQEYIDNHALGDEGVNMIIDCKSHPQVKGCWKEITAALPWRPYVGVYHRAHTLFEGGSKGIWTPEDLEFVKEHQKKHGNDWRAIADAMGKHRKHVKDAWRRIRLGSTNKGHWSRVEYQTLFDLVNKDIRMKAFQEKRAKHGMLRDNIPWMAISDQLGTRNHTLCCIKWYDQLTSPMVAKGIWANVDDYRLIDELTNLDAACVDDVDWDYLLDNRDGDACRKRWNQMVHNIGLPGTKTFAEQVEILAQRYCPDLAEDREDFDNRPFDPED